MVTKNGTRFAGNWVSDTKGKGRIFYKNGDVFIGGWLELKPHRYGVMEYKSGKKYDGPWVKGLP